MILLVLLINVLKEVAHILLTTLSVMMVSLVPMMLVM